MFEWPALGALIAVAVPVVIIFLVLGVFRIVQRQAERAVRSPDYWDEVPDGKRYPTGWGEDESAQGSEDRSPEETAENTPEGNSEPDPPRTEER
ncbi:hypothetical protein [Nocardiopsis valliformis]|uniref:hypothetical protein n=1 Tax=Nocardiopsis valliformis TaxID=239974 RepID=UPI000346D28B|nr:hypothetical protein [Nocardiopsis valliformis]